MDEYRSVADFHMVGVEVFDRQVVDSLSGRPVLDRADLHVGSG